MNQLTDKKNKGSGRDGDGPKNEFCRDSLMRALSGLRTLSRATQKFTARIASFP